jgi:DNA-binding transcriptional LysR family regulator
VFEVAEPLADGSLVEVLPEARPQSVTLGILYPTRRMLPPRTKAFIEMAVEELRRHLAAQEQLLPERQAAFTRS